MPGTDDAEERRNTILVVSERPEGLDELRRQLESIGLDPDSTDDVAGAVKRVKTDEPDMVLLDAEAMGEQVKALAGELRQDPHTETIPLIVIVGGRTEDQEEQALAIGADGFICRPFHRAELITRVKTLARMKTLVDKVAEQNRELMARNRELEMGRDMAHRLQEALLPQQYPRLENISFAHAYRPAEAVGGDVFQIIDLEEGLAAVFIADVSGHGIRAALVSSIVNAVIDYIDFENKTPSQVMQDFNSRFRSILGPMTPQIYATGVVMVVDGPRRHVSIANAGHPCPLLVSKSEMSARPIMTLDDLGPAVGFIPDPEYPTLEFDLTVGDILLAFTDGIYEVTNREGEMFGLKRLQGLIAENAHLVPRDLIHKIVTETGAFMASSRRPDDVCVVTLEVG